MPAEPVAAAADTLARAALGPPVRDLATTRQGAVSYALVRRTPRRLIDWLTFAQLRRLARKGHFGDSALAGELVARLRS